MSIPTGVTVPYAYFVSGRVRQAKEAGEELPSPVFSSQRDLYHYLKTSPTGRNIINQYALCGRFPDEKCPDVGEQEAKLGSWAIPPELKTTWAERKEAKARRSPRSQCSAQKGRCPDFRRVPNSPCYETKNGQCRERPLVALKKQLGVPQNISAISKGCIDITPRGRKVCIDSGCAWSPGVSVDLGGRGRTPRCQRRRVVHSPKTYINCTSPEIVFNRDACNNTRGCNYTKSGCRKIITRRPMA